MTFWSGDKLRKPDPKAFDKSLVAPEWLWFWERSKITLLMAEGQASVFDFANNQFSTTNTATWQIVAPHGPELTGAPAVSRLEFPLARTGLTDLSRTNGGFTVIAGVNYTGTANQVVAEINANSGWTIQTLTFLLCGVSGTAASLRLHTSAINDGLNHLVHFSFNPIVTDDEVYVDGLNDTVNQPTIDNDPNYGVVTDIDLFSRNGAVGFRFPIWFFAVLDGPITAARAAQHAHDPFGMFRMVDENEAIAGSDILITPPTDSLIPILKRRRR